MRVAPQNLFEAVSCGWIFVLVHIESGDIDTFENVDGANIISVV